MRGKLMFISGLAAGFVLGSRAGREKYEEIRANAKKVWEHPTVQEAAGVAQAQANKLYSRGQGQAEPAQARREAALQQRHGHLADRVKRLAGRVEQPQHDHERYGQHLLT